MKETSHSSSDAKPTAATAPAQPAAPVTYAPRAENPGQTLGVIGLVLNILGITPGGIILGIMSRNKSKEAGMSSDIGTISLVWGIIGTVLGVILFVLMIIGFVLIALSDGSSTSSTRHGTSQSIEHSLFN